MTHTHRGIASFDYSSPEAPHLHARDATLADLLLTGATPANGQPTTAAQFSSQERGLGSEYQISTPSNPETDRYKPAAAVNTSFHQTLVVWHRNGGGSYFIEGRLLDAMGKPLGSGPTILVSGSTPVYQPAVAYNAAYNQYLVVWMRNSNLDGKTYDVWGKILSANLTEVRPEYQIFHYDGSGCWTPRVAWNSKKNEYMVGYERQSATGQDIWVAYNNNGANTLSISGYTFWLDNFSAAAYGFWTNSTPTGLVVGPNVQIAYQGVSNTPGDHPHIYTRAWTPYLTYLPNVCK